MCFRDGGRGQNWDLTEGLYLCYLIGYSGCWPSACAAMRINGVYIQAACSPAKQTADSYEDSFSQAWLKVQMNRSLDALEQFPLVQFRNPHFYRPQCSSALNLGALEFIFFLS